MLGQIFAHTYNLTKGIKKFGDKGWDATLAKVKKIHDGTCFRPIDANKITSQERKRSMESLVFIMEKRDGTIKGRAFANGSIRQYWINK